VKFTEPLENSKKTGIFGLAFCTVYILTVPETN